MQFHFDISSNQANKEANPQQLPQPAGPPAPLGERVLEVLQQTLELQRQQFAQMNQLLAENLNHARAAHAEHMARWKGIIGRWDKDFPFLPELCKQVYPMMEKAYVKMIHSMVTDLVDQGDDAMESEYELMDFIDKNGVRLGQFGHLLGVVGAISETAPPQQQQA